FEANRGFSRLLSRHGAMPQANEEQSTGKPPYPFHGLFPLLTGLKHVQSAPHRRDKESVTGYDRLGKDGGTWFNREVEEHTRQRHQTETIRNAVRVRDVRLATARPGGR